MKLIGQTEISWRAVPSRTSSHVILKIGPLRFTLDRDEAVSFATGIVTAVDHLDNRTQENP